MARFGLVILLLVFNLLAISFGNNVDVITWTIKNLDFCSTINFVEFKTNIESPLPQILTNLKKINGSGKRNSEIEMKSYFHHEWSPLELKNSLIFGASKYTSNCVVTVFSETTFTSTNVVHLLWGRYLRPHLDHVIILGSSRNVELIERFSNVYLERRKFEKLQIKSAELNGKIFRVVASSAVHLVDLKFDRTALDLHGGVEYWMLRGISQANNFTMTIDHATGGGATGTKLANGTWVGVVGDVYNERADFGIGAGTSRSRQTISDASNVHEYVRLTFFTRSPFPVNRWEALFWSFDKNVWYSLGLVTFITLLIIFLLLNFENSHRITQDFSDLWKNLWRATEIILALGLEQSLKMVNKPGVQSRMRFLLLLWALGSLLIGTAYKSKLVSFLTLPCTQKIPETFQELGDAPEYEVNFKTYGGLAYNAFKTSQFPVQRKLFSRFKVEKNLHKCIESVALAEKAVCIVYKEEGSSAIASNFTLTATSTIDFFATAKEFGLIVPLAWAFPKGSPLTEKFSRLIGIIKASGLHDFWSGRENLENKMSSASWLKGAGDNLVAQKIRQFYSSLERTIKPLLTQHMLGPFALLIFGLVLSCVLFILEVLVNLRVVGPQLIWRIYSDVRKTRKIPERRLRTLSSATKDDPPVDLYFIMIHTKSI